MSLLPSTPDLSAAEETEPRVLGVDSEDADDVIGALSSETARELLTALHEQPDSPAALADRVDTSLQNAQYHLGKLEGAGVIEVVDTVYSEKGREMNVYAPADQPLVIFAGRETTSLRTALTRLLGAVGVLALASIVVQGVFGGGIGALFGAPGGVPAAGAGGGDAGAAPTATPTPAEDLAVAEATRTAVEAAGGGGLPPGLLFFAGGAAVLVVGFALWYARGEPRG